MRTRTDPPYWYWNSASDPIGRGAQNGVSCYARLAAFWPVRGEVLWLDG